MSLTEQQALAFVQGQLTHVESEIYKIDKEILNYSDFIDVDTSAGEFSNAVTFSTMDTVGQAELITPRTTDIPLADITKSQSTEPVYMAGIGYEYDYIEINQASLLGINLSTEKANAAFRAYEEFVQDTAMTGIRGVSGSTGLVNSTVVPQADAAAGTGGTTWLTKTADEIKADVDTALTASYTRTKRTAVADTLALPPSRFAALSTKGRAPESDLTALEFIQKSNIYTATTGQPLKIKPVSELEEAGVGGVERMLTYRKDKRNAKLHIPMVHRFMQLSHVPGTILYKRPGIFRIAGVDIRNTSSFQYTDGI